MTLPTVYTPRRESHSEFVPVRNMRIHVRQWGDASLASPDRPPLMLLHGWMDVGASFQFLVDALADLEGPTRWIVAPDWRGFGLTESPPTDSYWFPDYLADLEPLISAITLRVSRPTRVDLLGHSMGGNVAMLYAGVRPQRVRRLVNLEGFGSPRTDAGEAPARYARWLDELSEDARLTGYHDLAAVARRLQTNNPLLAPDRAAWLATQWARRDERGTWRVLADEAHKRVNPVLYRADEALACWAAITAPLLWVEGDQSSMAKHWGDRYPRSEFLARLQVVPRVEMAVLSPAGHMLHHDQPEALAARLMAFLGE